VSPADVRILPIRASDTALRLVGTNPTGELMATSGLPAAPADQTFFRLFSVSVISKHRVFIQ
jgi:hypothetical protein